MIKHNLSIILVIFFLFACSEERKEEAPVPVLSPVDQAISELVHSDKFVREKAALKLGKIGDKKATPELIASLDDREGRVRAASAKALGALKDSSAIKRLLEIGKSDPDLEVRRSVALAIASINQGGDEVISLLLSYLQDPNPSVRVQAAETFGALKEKAKPAVPRLIKSLDDTNKQVRDTAESALVLIGAAAVDDLSVAIREGRFYTRDSAARILEKIGTEEALEALRTSKEDEE